MKINMFMALFCSCMLMLNIYVLLLVCLFVTRKNYNRVAYALTAL